MMPSEHAHVIQCQRNCKMSMSRNLAWMFTNRTWEALAKQINSIVFILQVLLPLSDIDTMQSLLAKSFH